MILPRPDFNTQTNKYESIIMVSVRDSLGAIRNITSVVEVNPPNSSLIDQIS